MANQTESDLPTISRLIFWACVLVSLIAMPSAIVAQATGNPLELTGMVAVRDVGWQQIYDTEEILIFGLDVLVTLALTALIAYHPIRMATRRSLDDLKIPPLFLLYGLIGMSIGFFVDQHGYVIGFVIFGIGGLVRFRSQLENTEDTVEMIVATFLGLCVGLNLPVVAVMIATAVWLIIYMAGRIKNYELEIRTPEGQTSKVSVDRARALIEGKGWPIVWETQNTGKQSNSFVFRVHFRSNYREIYNELEAILDPAGLQWRLRS